MTTALVSADSPTALVTEETTQVVEVGNDRDAAFIWGRIIDSTAPSNQQVLAWSTSTSRWTPMSVPAISGAVAITGDTMTGDLVMTTSDILPTTDNTGNLGLTGKRWTSIWAYAATFTNTVTATTFSGALSGNATTSTALANPRTIGGVSFDGSANIVPQTIQVVDSTDASSSIAMFDSATGNLQPKTDGGLTYNATTGVLTATGFAGPLTGNVTGDLTGNADTATLASTVTVVDTEDVSTFVGLFGDATGSLACLTDEQLTYVANTGILTATGFAGDLTGDVTGNVSGSSGSTTGNAATATLAATVTVADESSDTTCFPAFFTAASGPLEAKTDTSNLTYNSSTGEFASTLFAGALNGTVGATTPASVAATTLDASGATTITGSPPLLFLVAPDEDANERVWRFSTNLAGLVGAAVNDALDVATRWLRVVRSGTTIDTIELTATLVDVTAFRANSIVSQGTITSDGNISNEIGGDNAAPALIMKATDAGTAGTKSGLLAFSDNVADSGKIVYTHRIGAVHVDSMEFFTDETLALALDSSQDATFTGDCAANTFTGPLTGNADTATLAADATTLETPRDINGVAFDGSQAITITAAAGTLTGTTLKSTVVTSSLTSLGTIGSLVATTADINGGTIDGTNIGVSAQGSLSATTGAFSGDVAIANGNGLVVGHSALIVFAGALAPELQQIGTGAADTRMGFARWSEDGSAASLRFLKSRNATIGSNAAVITGDQLGEIIAFGDDGTDFDTLSAAIIFDTEGTIDTGQVPGVIKFKVAAAGTLADALVLASDMEATFSGIVTVADATDTTGVGTGALRVAGGIDAAKKVFVGTDLTVTKATYRANSGGYYWSAQGTAAVGTQGTYVKVSTASSTTSFRAENFTIDTNNRATYTGTSTQTFRVTYVLTMTAETASRIYGLRIAKTGTSIVGSTIQRKIGTVPGDEAAITVEYFVELATNDYVELFATDTAGTADVMIEHGTCVITEA